MDQIKLKEVTEDVFRLIDKRDKSGIMRTLESNSSIPIIDIVDSRGYTILHMCCFKNLEDITNAVMDKALESVKEPAVHAWVNQKTEDDGFTALHFTSFRGNVLMARLLLDNGADMTIKNNFGINVLHVAA